MGIPLLSKPHLPHGCMNAKSHPQGSILLLSLFIMLAIVATGLAIAGLIQIQITQTRNEDNAVRARYAAESGLERGLDIVMSHRLETQPGATTNLEETLAIVESLSGTLINGEATYAFDTDATNEQIDTMEFSLREGESIELILFDPDNFLTPSYAIESAAIDWIEGDGCSGTSIIQATTQVISSSDGFPATQGLIPCGSFPALEGFDCRAETNNLTTSFNYLVRIKAQQCDIAYAKVTFYSVDDAPSGSEQSIASEVVLTADGMFASSHATLQAMAPWRIPASGFARYVLFVEGDIRK